MLIDTPPLLGPYKVPGSTQHNQSEDENTPYQELLCSFMNHSSTQPVSNSLRTYASGRMQRSGNAFYWHKFEAIAFKSQAHAGPKQREQHLLTPARLLGDHQQLQQWARLGVVEMGTVTACRSAAAAPEKQAKADSPSEWAHVLCAAQVDHRRRHDAPPAHC